MLKTKQMSNLELVVLLMAKKLRMGSLEESMDKD